MHLLFKPYKPQAPEDDPSTLSIDESLPHDGFPRQVGIPGYRHWTISGSTYDKYGYWGPAYNYVIATPTPFFTHDMSSEAVAVPPGNLENPINGVSEELSLLFVNLCTSTYTHHSSYRYQHLTFSLVSMQFDLSPPTSGLMGVRKSV